MELESHTEYQIAGTDPGTLPTPPQEPRAATPKRATLPEDPVAREWRIANRRRRRQRVATRVLSVILFLGGWQLIGLNIDPIFFSYPTKILGDIPAMVRDGLIGDLGISLQAFGTGFGISLVVGIPLGLLIGRYSFLNDTVHVQLTALYVTPYIALLPLFILWFGLGFKAAVAIVIVSCILTIVFTVRDGVANLSERLLEIGKVEGASQWQLFRHIILPGTVPNMMTGIRLGLGRAVVAMVVAEMFTALTGLGGELVQYGNLFLTDKVLLVVVVLCAIGYGLTELVIFLEALLAPWKRTETIRA